MTNFVKKSRDVGKLRGTSSYLWINRLIMADIYIMTSHHVIKLLFVKFNISVYWKVVLNILQYFP